MATLKITVTAESGIIMLPQSVVDELGLTIGEYVFANRVESVVTLIPAETPGRHEEEAANRELSKRDEMLRRMAE